LQGPVDGATVYVLVCPGQLVHLFRAFQSLQMEDIIKQFPRGSVLHYHAVRGANRVLQIERH
jgi:hypothetical protein